MNAFLLQAATGVQWAPTTVAGYVSLALSVLALTGVAVGYGKWLEKLNGMGQRVGDLEAQTITASVERAAQERTVVRLLDQHEQMLVQLGEAKRGTTSCREDTEELGIRIGTAVTDLTRGVSEMKLELSTRLTKVETILTERRSAE